MRVLHVQKAKGIGGSERHLLDLLPALASRGDEPSMLVLSAPGADVFVDEMRRRGVAVETIPAGPDANPLAVAAIARAIRRARADLVHTHLVHADVHGQLAARIARTRAISTFHSVDPRYRRPPVRQAAAAAARSARLTICISAHVRGFVVANRIAPARRARVVHYGIDVAGWSAAAADGAATRAELGLGADDVVVGVAARLVPGKGHPVLLRAFAAARGAEPRLRLLVAGDGPERARLERAAGDGVRFLGFVRDVPRFMAACDVVAFPTLPELGEGFGLAALEAMAAGLPVVASDIPALREVVADGETGLLVPPADADALARAVARLVAPTLRERMGASARERAASLFSLDRMVDATRALYEEALA